VNESEAKVNVGEQRRTNVSKGERRWDEHFEGFRIKGDKDSMLIKETHFKHIFFFVIWFFFFGKSKEGTFVLISKISTKSERMKDVEWKNNVVVKWHL